MPIYANNITGSRLDAGTAGITIGNHTLKDYGGDLTIESYGDDINIVGSWLRFRATDNGGVTSAFHGTGTLNLGGDGQTTYMLKVSSGNSYMAGNLTVGGNITAQQFITEYNTTTVIATSGSTKWGDSEGDKHQFTGSVEHSGSLVMTDQSPAITLYDTNVSNLRHRIIAGGNTGIEYGSDLGDVGAGYHRWDIANSEKMRLIENGNLGIGDTSPGSKLVVVGTGDNARFGSTSDGIVLGHGSGFGSIQGTDTEGSAYNALRFRTSGNYAMTIDTSNRVGIGITSPDIDLHIRGTRTASSNLFHNVKLQDGSTAFNANPATGIAFGGQYNNTPSYAIWGGIMGKKENATHGDAHGMLQFTTNDNAGNQGIAMTIDSDQKVGIGTTSPGVAKLNVYGTGAGTAFLYVGDGSPNNDSGWDANIMLDSNQHSRIRVENRGDNKNLEILSHTGYNPMIRATDSGTGLRLGVGGTDSVTIGTNPYLNVHGTMTVAGQATFSSNIIIAAGYNLYLDGGSNTYITEDTADNINFYTGGTERLRIDGSGMLVIRGNNKYLYGLTSGNATVSLVGVKSNNWIQLGHSGYGLVTGTGGFSIDGADNASIAGDFTVVDHNFKIYSGGDGSTGLIRLYDTGDVERGEIYAHSTNQLRFWVSSNGIYNFQNGNVAINKDNAMLSIGHAGESHWGTGNDILEVGHSMALWCETADGADRNAFIGNNIYVDGSGYKRHYTDQTVSIHLRAGYIAFRTDASGTAGAVFTPTERMRITEDGKIGVGTNAPSKHIHIYNTSGDVRGLMVETTVAASYAEYQLKASREWRVGTGGSSTTPNGKFYVFDASASAHRFDIDTNGNVGIGSTSPSQKLDVNGTAKAAAFRLANGFVLGQGSSTYGQLNSWIDVLAVGLYSSTVNSAHIYPNATTDYGAWRIQGSRNGYTGITFTTDSSHFNTLMSNSTYMGFYDDSNNEWMVRCQVNNATWLYYNGVGKLETTSGGIRITGGQIATPSGENLQLVPNTGVVTVSNDLQAVGGLQAGNGAFKAVGDFNMYSDNVLVVKGYDSGGSGHLVTYGNVRPNSNGGGSVGTSAERYGTGWINTLNFDTGETVTSSGGYVIADGNAGVILRENGSNRIVLNSNTLRPDGNNSTLLGSSSQRWSNVYTQLMNVAGKITATSKSFLIDHPTKEGKKLEHGSLEGPENGVYVRGKCETNIIELPDYWLGLVDEDTITVQITPLGSWQKLYVKKIEDNKVYVSKFGFGSPKFFYNVYGERKDIDKMEVEYDGE